MKGGSLTYVAMILAEQGKWGEVEYIVAIDAKTSKVHNVAVMAFEEKRGRPIARKRFLSQFNGKSAKDPIKLNKDIKSVTGATISSKSAAQVVKQCLLLYENVYK